MAVLKMKLVNIVGPVDDFDQIVTDHIINKKMNLENAMEVLNNTKGHVAYEVTNHYRAYRSGFEGFFQIIGEDRPAIDYGTRHFNDDEISGMISKISSKISVNRLKIEQIDAEMKENIGLLHSLEYIMSVDVPLKKLFTLEFMKFRFGKLPKAGYKTLNTYIEDLETFFIVTKEDREQVWGMYFMPIEYQEKVDALFSSLYFKRIRLSDKLVSSPDDEFMRITNRLNQLKKERSELEHSTKEMVKNDYNTIINMYQFVLKEDFIDKFRGYCSHTKESFHMIGWMAEENILALEKELDQEKTVMVVSERPEEVKKSKPPTLMKNLAVFRPFEALIRMYGLPSYSELDPTVFVGITYFLMFGIMFGDVGQGAILSILGFLLYKWKKIDLGAVAGMVGISSVCFGFVYGSVFGNENILPHRLISPLESINQVLAYAVAFGAILIVIAMVLNVVNGFKSKDKGKILVGQNSIAGLIFYVAVLLIVLKMFTGKGLSASPIIIILFIAAPLIVIMFQEPLSKLLAKCKKYKPEEPGMFLVEAFFELFEIILSFITNSMSFLRVGAFALNHAGMMMVVYLLAKMAGNGGNIVVLIVGNIFVMGMEGFIVAIQILRLEFYEMFSRFFGGDGIEFKSIKTQINN